MKAAKKLVEKPVLPFRLGVYPPSEIYATENTVAFARSNDELCKQRLKSSAPRKSPYPSLPCSPTRRKPRLPSFSTEEVLLQPEDADDREPQEEDPVSCREWGRCVEEVTCDKDSWALLPLPPALTPPAPARWNRDSKDDNFVSGVTCADFKMTVGADRLEKNRLELRKLLPMVSEYQATICDRDNSLPVTKPPGIPTYAPRPNMLNPFPPRYVSEIEDWQSTREDPWDRANLRDLMEKPPQVLPDARKRQLKPRQEDSISSERITEELLALAKTDQFRKELTRPVSGYTGHRMEYYNPQTGRCRPDEPHKHDDVYQTTSRTSHRPFPASEYEKQRSIWTHKSPLSNTVTDLFPPHPFRSYKPVRYGRWQNTLDQKIWGGDCGGFK